MYETCFRDRGIDWLCVKRVSGIGGIDQLCVKRVSEIGVLVEVLIVIPSIILSFDWVLFEEGGEGLFIK